MFLGGNIEFEQCRVHQVLLHELSGLVEIYMPQKACLGGVVALIKSKHIQLHPP
jgi:hypothetical protein